MTFPRGIRATVAAALLVLGFAAGARAADVPTHVVAANVNDAGIDASRGSMSGGGVTNLPQDWTEMGSEGGRLGYHTIVLAYRNEAPIQTLPPDGCGTGVEPPPSPPNCAINARMEILDGRGESPVVAVDRANSIENRLLKALQHLAATYPGEGWAQFLDAGATPKWSEIVAAGASLGAGEAVLIGMLHSVDRVVAFQGWTDAKHGWEAIGLTPSSRYFALSHQRENLFERTCFAYVAFGLAQSCPLAGFTGAINPANPLLVENRQPPFGSRQLVHNLEPFKLDGVADPYQTSTTRNDWLPRDADLAPARKLVNGWRSVLGDSDADTRLDAVDNCPLVANVEQVDSDRNGTGDACGPTLASGAVSGAVPATLALTLGPAVAFGAFTPGVDRNYDASTTATVISSAGDATLSVSDPGANAAGRLVNGAFSLAEPLQGRVGTAAFAPLGTLLTYAGPVSNDVVTIGFRQHIGPTQALRTGVYSKTLTFTLSTTTP
jgi:hypothetical protein